MFGKILFQTVTRLLKKKAMQNLIKKKPTAYPQNKRRKKNKNPKTQIVFLDQNSDSLRLAILRYTFKHTDRTYVFQPIKQTKNKASIIVKTSATVEIFVRSLQQAIYKLSGLCSSTINNSEDRHFPPFFVFYSIAVSRVSRKKKGIVEGRHFSLISHLFL